MIQKRYKNTEKLQAAEALKMQLNNESIIVAEILLPELEERTGFDQYLRVRDMNIAPSANYLKITPKRILKNKTNGKEIETNLFVPTWEFTASTVTPHFNNEGDRETYEMEWFDDETGESVTTKTEIQLNEENEEIGVQVPLPELEDEFYYMPSIAYLMNASKSEFLPVLIKKHLQKFVDDHMVWSREIEPS